MNGRGLRIVCAVLLALLALCAGPGLCYRLSGCPPLKTRPSSASTACSSGPASLGSQCSFSCPQGQPMIGFATLTCLQDGTWSSATPRCDGPSCPSLTRPPGATVTGNCYRAKAQDTCVFACPTGQLLGAPTLVCGSDLVWSSAAPTCRTSSGSCPTLSKPTNGDSRGSCQGASPNQECVFFCNAGYSMSGSPTLRCMADGFWSSSAPICRPIN